MASPAAYLDIVVDLNTGTASTDLRRLNSSLSKFDRTQATATTRTSSLGKATSTLGTRMRSAAGYAAGAAAAYLSISQAKTAVTTTQDLAKTTAGLNRNLGLTVGTASQWGAVAKARDIDTKSLNMSFTTLSRNLVEAKKGTQASVEQFHRLGITQEELKGQSFDQAILSVADAFGEAEGGAVRQATAQKLLGRGYQTVLPLFAEGSKSLEEQLGWADKYGAELSGPTLKAQMDLVNAQRESKVAMLGMQVAFTKALTPALQRANEEFQRISEIMASDKLTKEEKWERVGRIIGKWGDKAFDAFIGILPRFIEEAGERAPKIAAAFAKGFIDADIWGKVFAAAWLIRLMGGFRMFSTQGKLAGQTFGAGMVLGAVVFGPIIGQQIKQAVEDALSDIDLPFGLNIPNPVDVATDPINAISKVFGGEGNIPTPTKLAFDAVEKLGDKEEEVLNDSLKTQRDYGGKSGKIFGDWGREVMSLTGQTQRKGNKDLDELTNRGVNAAGKLNRGVSNNVHGMVNATINGIGHLTSETSKALKAFGVKPLNYTPKALAKGATKTITGGILRNRGGNVPGSGNTDSVPAMLTPGEYVVNAKATARNRGLLEAINMRRYAKGGLVQALGPYDIPPIQYDPNHAGGNSHLHLSMSSVGAAQALARQIAPMGWTASEAPWAGGLSVAHSDPGHYSGSAFDANTAANETRSEVAAVARILGGAGGAGAAVAQKLARVILQGPRGPLRDMGQSALDKTRRAAQKFIDSKQPTVTGGVNTSVPVGPVQEMARAMINQIWGPEQWSPFNLLEIGEAGWDPRAYNASSGAAGLAQALPASKYPPGAWPYKGPESARLQLQWMMGYIQDNYGTPANAYSTWLSRSPHWYSKGGPVGNYAAGGDVARGGLARVHRGERISPPGTPHVEIVLNGSMDAVLDEVDVLIDGRKAEIADYTLREGGRTRGRARQMAGR